MDVFAVVATALSRTLESLLLHVSPTDPIVLGVVIAGLATIAMLAAWIPARRASRVDPMIALRTK